MSAHCNLQRCMLLQRIRLCAGPTIWSATTQTLILTTQMLCIMKLVTVVTHPIMATLAFGRSESSNAFRARIGQSFTTPGGQATTITKHATADWFAKLFWFSIKITSESCKIIEWKFRFASVKMVFFALASPEALPLGSQRAAVCANAVSTRVWMVWFFKILGKMVKNICLEPF